MPIRSSTPTRRPSSPPRLTVTDPRSAGESARRNAVSIGPAKRPPRSTERRVAAQNAASSVMEPQDLMAVFAGRAAQALEGGRAAVLRPEKRAGLLRESAALGLRPFDANVVIAIAQDSARRGERTPDLARYRLFDKTASAVPATLPKHGAVRALMPFLATVLSLVWASLVVAWMLR